MSIGKFESLVAGLPASPDAGIFGMTIDSQEAELTLIPVPWDATASYGLGTERGPEAILAASHQLDLEDFDFGKPYLFGISMLKADMEISILNQISRRDAAMVREGRDRDVEDLISKINGNSQIINDKVYGSAKAILQRGKLCAVVGGDHSSPYGLIKALSERYDNFGVLHIDAHFDLRVAYEGFEWSHASIMANCLRDFPQIKKIFHLAIRDFSHSERESQKSMGARSSVLYSSDLFRRKASGETFQTTVRTIIEALPQNVYISFDVDGLDPSLCPSTGTPVPGGLQFEEAMFLIAELTKAGKSIIGFDLCEVADPNDGSEWDANVGARVLYKLCGALLNSRHRGAVR